MKIVGSVRSRVTYRFSDREINKEVFIKSNVPNKLKDTFSFSKINIPEDLAEESIELIGGRLSEPEAEVFIDKLSIGNMGLGAVVWGETEKAKKVLDEACRIIDGERLFNSLATGTKKVRSVSECKVNLKVPPENFLSPKFVDFLHEVSSEFAKEDFDIEIHLADVEIAFVAKPNLLRIGERSLSTSDIIDLIRETRPQMMSISFENMDDFYNRNYLVRMEADYEKLEKILERIEKELQP